LAAGGVDGAVSPAQPEPRLTVSRVVMSGILGFSSVNARRGKGFKGGIRMEDGESYFGLRDAVAAGG